MRPATRATLDELEKVEWFRSVGGDPGRHVLHVHSWQEAIELCNSPLWEEVQLEAANQLGAAIRAKSSDAYQRWNDIVDDVKPVVVALVARKTQRVVEQYGLPDVFVSDVQWDIVSLAIEAEYSHLVPTGFYAELAYWYREGRFPCGWVGGLATGKLVVF